MDPKFVRLGRPDPIVCADSVLNVAFERRDPGAMRRFLEDFGFLPVEQRDQTTYFRGHGSALNAPFDFLLGPYNDLEAVEALVKPHRAELAAILIEPMQGTTGCILAERSFLAGLRSLASETGALLIFDEVMTSRLAPGGLQTASCRT